MQAEKKLFNHDFILVVIGQIISLFGNAILRFALPYYLLKETGSSALFGIVTACSFLPMVILSLVGGIIADRTNKRNIMVILDFVTAIIILVFYLSLGRIPIIPLFIVALMLLYGISGAYQPAVQASIPLLVSSDKLTVGNAVINQVNTLANFIGPAISGVVFQFYGINPILIVSIICFTLSAIMEIFIHIPHQKTPREVGVIAVAKNDLKDSYTFLKREKHIFISVIFLVCIFNLVLSAVLIVGLPILISEVLKMPDTLYGFSISIIIRRFMWWYFNSSCCFKVKTKKSLYLVTYLFCFCFTYGNFTIFRIACNSFLLGSYSDVLCGYGRIYYVCCSNLHSCADTNATAISRKDNGYTGSSCYVRSTYWTNGLRYFIRCIYTRNMGCYDCSFYCFNHDFNIFKKNFSKVRDITQGDK